MEHAGAGDGDGYEVLGAFDPAAAPVALFHATPVPTVVIDLDHRIVTVNGAFRALFGFETEHISMEQLDGITRPEDREALHELRRARHGLVGPLGLVVGYATPPEHAYAAALEALCRILPPDPALPPVRRDGP